MIVFQDPLRIIALNRAFRCLSLWHRNINHHKNYQAMKKHASQKHAPKHQCPVSKKFYTSVSDRVRESLTLIGREDAVAATMACVDRYMADGTQPSADTDPAVRLVFALLRAEIDKAVERSSRARSRAAKRAVEAAGSQKSSAVSAVVSASAASAPSSSSLEPSAVPDAFITDAGGADAADDDPQPFVPRNRRERRLYEQEVRRATRRLVRRLAGA